jgi:hypothetical protein
VQLQQALEGVKQEMRRDVERWNEGDRRLRKEMEDIKGQHESQIA